MAPNSNGDLHLSEGVIIQILSWLPVKPLMRFRCVCKGWFIFKKNIRLVTKHLQYHQNNTRLLLVQRYNYSSQKYTFCILPYEMLGDMSFLYQDHDNLDMPMNPSVAGHFDGILCIWDQDHIALWNPAMRELRPLTVTQPDLPSYFNAWCHYIGLGSVPLSNDYKLFWFRYFWDEKSDNPYRFTVISVYTLGSDSWRLFEVDLSQISYMHPSLSNTCMNGVYYWLINNSDDNYMMLLFDMDKETFREAPAPPDISQSQLGQLSLYNDYIALFIYNPSEIEKHFDIWVMKEEGNWSKLLTTKPLHVNGPLGFSENEEIFLESNSSQLVLYNISTQEIKYLGPCEEGNSLKVFLCKESLVSVKKENECWDGHNSVWLEYRACLHSICLKSLK